SPYQATSPVTAHHVHLGCQTSYHHDFSVKNKVRTYYDHIPDVIQVGSHQFVERALIQLWRTDMNLAWKSATNCARSYEQALAKDHEWPRDWRFGSTLKTGHVYDGFIIL